MKNGSVFLNKTKKTSIHQRDTSKTKNVQLNCTNVTEHYTSPEDESIRKA